MPRPVLVFDMDGVLVEVSESYRESIRQTVQHFTGKEISHELIQDYKNQGGWNNDWALSQKICQDLGRNVGYETVVAEFQRIFLGENGAPGLILRERWIPEAGLLERLAERYTLAIFTGRLRSEADVTLQRFAPHLTFDPIVTDEVVTRPKPAPDGLLSILEQRAGAQVVYVGDTVDDARSSRDAQVPFVGIAAPDNPRREELVSLLQTTGAVAVIENINQLESVLPS